jgi:hypothetical protein
LSTRCKAEGCARSRKAADTCEPAR